MSNELPRQEIHNKEAEWLIEAQKGETNAFTYLVELYQKPVYSLCYRMLGNAEDAEDAAQETFMRAYKAIRRYDNKRPFSTWLLSIAAHHCIDQIRRRRFPIISVEELPFPELSEPSPGLETILVSNEEKNRIRSLLNVLEPLDRATVVLYYWYEFSYQEISELLSLSLSAVKSRLHRARRAMAENWIQIQPKFEQLDFNSNKSGCNENFLMERITP